MLGTLIWISYRASFTSKLSVKNAKVPFDNLENLLASDYKLIGPPSSYAISQFFINAEENSIYDKLYKNNMFGLESFYPLDKGIGTIIQGRKMALISLGDPIRFYTNYHCQAST